MKIKTGCYFRAGENVYKLDRKTGGIAGWHKFETDTPYQVKIGPNYQTMLVVTDGSNKGYYTRTA